MSTDNLITCPRCGTPNFTRGGLRAHVCRGSANRSRLTPSEIRSATASESTPSSPMPTASTPCSPASVTSTAIVPATRVDLEKLDANGLNQKRNCCVFDANLLAQRAKEMLSNIDGLRKERAMKAILAGIYLSEIKSVLGHGEFTAWIQDNFPTSKRTTQHYMQLAAKFARASKLLLPELISANQFTLELVTTDETSGVMKAKLEKFVGERGLTDLFHKHGVLGQRGGAQQKAKSAGDDDAPEEQEAPEWCTEPEREIWEKLATDEQRAAFLDWRPRIRCMAEQIQNPPQSVLVHLDETSRNDLVATAEQLLRFLAPGLLRSRA